MNCRGSGWWCSKALIFRVILLLGFIWFLWLAVLENGEATLNGQLAVGSSRKHMEVTGKRLLNAHKNLDINFTSKRRVPNGSDPVHNRRAGNSNRPPGRA